MIHIQNISIILIMGYVYYFSPIPRSIWELLVAISCLISLASFTQSLSWPWYFWEVLDSYFVIQFAFIWCFTRLNSDHDFLQDHQRSDNVPFPENLWCLLVLTFGHLVKELFSKFQHSKATLFFLCNQRVLIILAGEVG